MKSELKEYAYRAVTTGPYADNLEVDALVLGGGFGGVYCLHELRKQGLKTALYEAGDGLGGTWRWNRYPGAGVDSEIPEYQFSIPETYKDWTWSTNYPTYEELRAYFDHVDKVLDIKKDCAFGSVVVDAQFKTTEGRWHIKTEDGRIAKAKFFIVAAGFAAKRYIPDFQGINTFKGIIHHSSFWPEDGVNVRGKRCAVIGTGASGVQITQAWGPEVGSLKVFQRTPNLAIPMRKRKLTVQEQQESKYFYPELFSLREKCFGGFLYTFCERGTFDDTPEEREAFLEQLWEKGGFRYWLGNYKDYLLDKKANNEVYNFWAKNVRARIVDTKQRDLLAPLKPPHPFVGFTETGIQLQDGTIHEFDVICVATGFDVSTGGMTSMGLRSIHGESLEDEWKAAATTYLGTTVSGYPNMFHLYGPQGPTLLSNGPTSVEVQGRWIIDAIKQIQRLGIKYIDPTPEATKEWKKRINYLSDMTLFPTTKSTYMGGSIPGKVFEQVNYAGGLPAYAQEIREKIPSFDGFNIVKD